MSIPHIVIAEDNLPDVMVFREALARRGIAFTIEHFSNGEQAAEAIEAMSQAPDLFVLDLNLPRVDGFSLLRQIRQRDLTAQSPVAVLTTSRDPQDRARCEALGTDAYLVKPAGFTEFLDLVGAAVQLLLSGNAAGASRRQEPAVRANSAARWRLPRLAAVLTRARRRVRGRARAARSPE